MRIAPQWSYRDVRLAAETLAREVENRAPGLATARWWKEERGESVFVDFNQNAKDRTVASAYSIRPLPDARVSTPLDWDEVTSTRPEQFTVPTVLERFAAMGDPHAGIDDAVGTLDRLISLAAELGPAEKPPRGGDGLGRRQSIMPLIEVARTKTKPEALAALEEWKTRHPDLVVSPAPRRRARRRHAGIEFALVPGPGEPAARPGRGAAAAGGAHRRLRPLGRQRVAGAPWILTAGPEHRPDTGS